MTKPMIRLSRPTDINTLVALDLKAYNYPLSMDDWKVLVHGSGKKKEPRVVLLELMGRPAGFCMWKDAEPKEGEEERIVDLLRVGITPSYRKRGLGRLIVDRCAEECNRDRVDKIRILVPEVHCVPDDPDNIVGFLNKVDFNPTGEIIDNYKVMYGDSVDAFVFERKLF
jgi:GNAT superfamily N-acetyltransferase